MTIKDKVNKHFVLSEADLKNYHFYVDDTQLYITLSPANFSHSMQKLNNCLNDIQNFMFTNKLKVNLDKTEFILIGSPKK